MREHTIASRSGSGSVPWLRCLPPVLFLSLLLFPTEEARAQRWLQRMPADPLALRPLDSLVVRGNQTTDERLIRRTSGLEAGRTVNADRLQDAVRALFGLGLFSSITVRDWPDSAGGRGMAIEVSENPRIGSLTWQGNKKLGEDDLKSKIDLRAGQLLTRRKLFEAQRAIEAAYRDQGYASALVEPQVSAPQNGKVDLELRVQEGKRVSIRTVDFEGNQAFSDGRLRGKMQLKPNSLFRTKRYTADRLREDQGRLEEFYRNHGYKDVTVSAEEPVFGVDQHEVHLRYGVQEGPLYRFGRVHWQGNTAVTTEALQAASAVIPGDPFSQAKLEATTAAAYELYTEKGYLLQLSVVPETQDSGDTVHVAYAISEGEPSRIHEVTILGDTRTKERVIRRELSLFPGQLLRRSVLLRSQRDVFALGFFEDVQFDYVPAGTGSDIDVSFTVKEKSSTTATAGAAYSSDTGLTGFVEFGSNNVLGNGQSISVHLERGSQRETYDVSFTEPWMLGTPTSLGLQIYNTVREYDVYTERARGGGINLGRPWFFKFPDFSRVYAGYSLEDLRYTQLDEIDVASRTILNASSGTASRLTLSFTRNSTDNPFYPTLGSRTTARIELAGGPLGGQLDYYKPLLDHRVYFVPFWKPALMLRNRMTYLGTYRRGGRIPGSETFRLGGTRTDYLRGYPDYEVLPETNVYLGSDGKLVRFPGGRLAYTFTAEYQFPVVNPVHGLFFLDAGNAWNSPSDFSLGDLRKGVGAGIRLEIPMLGPVGFDYAYGLDRGKWEAHFIIGPAF